MPQNNFTTPQTIYDGITVLTATHLRPDSKDFKKGKERIKGEKKGYKHRLNQKIQRIIILTCEGKKFYFRWRPDF